MTLAGDAHRSTLSHPRSSSECLRALTPTSAVRYDWVVGVRAVCPYCRRGEVECRQAAGLPRSVVCPLCDGEFLLTKFTVVDGYKFPDESGSLHERRVPDAHAGKRDKTPEYAARHSTGVTGGSGPWRCTCGQTTSRSGQLSVSDDPANHTDACAFRKYVLRDDPAAAKQRVAEYIRMNTDYLYRDRDILLLHLVEQLAAIKSRIPGGL